MTLTNGFELTVDENALHDWEVVETICEIDNGNSTKLPALFNAILGEEQKKALVAYQREKTPSRMGTRSTSTATATASTR